MILGEDVEFGFGYKKFEMVVDVKIGGKLGSYFFLVVKIVGVGKIFKVMFLKRE